MEISERFHYHQQILEKMVATQERSSQDSPRKVPAGLAAEMGKPLDTERDDTNREDLVDGSSGGEFEEMAISDGPSPELDNGLDETDGGGRSLRYSSIDHSVHVFATRRYECQSVHPQNVQCVLLAMQVTSIA